LGLSVNPIPSKNIPGFTGFSGDSIIFSRRDRNTFDNFLAIKYNFNKNSGITVNVRHYWSKVVSRQFYTLQADGNLSENHSYTDPNNNANYNVNIFNVDFVYTWQFAPGSFMYIVWKNGINNYERRDGYFKNLNTTLGASQNNNLSLKLIYYLDYLKLRKIKSV
jgi:hypothetical protein